MIGILLQAEIPLGTFGGKGLLGPLGDPTNAPAKFAQVISNVIGFLTIVAGIWFLFQIIFAGYQWITAGADKQKLSEAQSKLTTSVVGLAIVVLAIIFARLITQLLGIQTILDPTEAIKLLSPGGRP